MNGKYAVALLIFFAAGFSAVYAQRSADSGRQLSALEYYRLGKDYQQEQRYYEAVEMFQESVRRNPASGDTWFLLASCSYQLEEYELALQYVENAQKYIKNSGEILNLKGFCLIGLGRTDEARALFAEVLSLFPNDIDARFGIAQLDLFDGRASGAERQYSDALRREPENRRALLSLALLAHEAGKDDAVREYMQKALQYHSGDADVYYFASYIAWQDGRLEEAEGYARAALRLNGTHDSALEMLALILYEAGRYQSAVRACDDRIKINRFCAAAWYLKACSYEKLGLTDDALFAYQTGLEIAPDDEVMRTAFEHLVLRKTDVEDSRRDGWSKYHADLAAAAAEKYFSVQAKFEYRRALTIYPLNISARISYAQMLLNDGCPEAYIANLRFIQSKGVSNRNIDDAVEAYQSLLRKSLASRWNVRPFYLEKTRLKLNLYAVSGEKQLLHPGAELCTAQLMEQYFAAIPYFAVSAENEIVSGYAEAFSRARRDGADYFALVSFSENSRDATVGAAVYSGRTGNEACSFSVFRTGNGRYADAVRKVVLSIAEAFPVRSSIIARKGSLVLLDSGVSDGVSAGDVFTVVKKGEMRSADSGTQMQYEKNAVLGTVTVTAVNEDIAQGELQQAGFYDMTNIGDELILSSRVRNDSAEQSLSDNLSDETSRMTDFRERTLPRLLEMIRKIK
ncbi:MAG: tetratricopeptide repeat protein [Bacteroides sp.]|nr:tetratricopeptide repeat protein [Prevotella sp.]MCM1407415.1 tetratricopeptide repeat protein [Treponema brennaborense]MCM1469905.1 tetratricopeptide repeat protein [Bacteroides sp.]